MIGIIDGDSFIYRCGFAGEKDLYLVEQEDGRTWKATGKAELKKNLREGDTVWSRKEVVPLDEAKSYLDFKLKEAITNAGVDDLKLIYLSPVSGNFREGISTVRKYKGNRDGSSRPIHYNELRDHLIDRWSATIVLGREADDKISWMARHHQKAGRDVIVIGVDKDLYQIPGLHYDWVSDNIIDFTEQDARAWFWTQVLAGDPGDNIIGCYGLGPTKARKIVLAQSDYSDQHMWPIVLNAYSESLKLPQCPYKGRIASSVALEMARLVRLSEEPYEAPWLPKYEEARKQDEEVQREDRGPSVGVRGPDLPELEETRSGV